LRYEIRSNIFMLVAIYRLLTSPNITWIAVPLWEPLNN